MHIFWVMKTFQLSQTVFCCCHLGLSKCNAVQFYFQKKCESSARASKLHQQNVLSLVSLAATSRTWPSRLCCGRASALTNRFSNWKWHQCLINKSNSEGKSWIVCPTQGKSSFKWHLCLNISSQCSCSSFTRSINWPHSLVRRADKEEHFRIKLNRNADFANLSTQ